MIHFIQDAFNCFCARRELRKYVNAQTKKIMCNDAVYIWFSTVVEDCISKHTEKIERAPSKIILCFPILLANGNTVKTFETAYGSLPVEVDEKSDAIIKVV